MYEAAAIVVNSVDLREQWEIAIASGMAAYKEQTNMMPAERQKRALLAILNSLAEEHECNDPLSQFLQWEESQ